LTTLTLAHAAGSSDLDGLYTRHSLAEITAAAARMEASQSAVQTVLAPLRASFSVTGNLLSDAFSANHTGMDALLDAITVTVSNGTVTIRNKATQDVFLSSSLTGLASSAVLGLYMPTPMGDPSGGTGATLYTANCAGCHGTLGGTSLRGVATLRNVQAAIAANRGGMGTLSGLSATDLQLIADALTNTSTPPVVSPPVTTAPNGAALYTAQCANCHGPLASSSKLGMTVVRLQNAISGNVGDMGALTTLTAADMQAIAEALNPATPPAPAPTPAPSPTPAPTPAPVDGASLYAVNCVRCHGALAVSSKQGSTLARLQTAIASNVGGMGSLSSLSVTEVQAIITALTPSTPTPTPAPTPTPTPAPSTDGAGLYASYCGACHGALAASTKGGATAARIQAAIQASTGGMGGLSSLTSAQINAISLALASISPPAGSPAACGSCHAIPPASGRHAKHSRENVSCGSCHGTGYTPTSVVAALHQNGVKNLAGNAGWNSTARTCSNACHGRETW
jgi:mono/diheme cytochrome c family protein